MTGPQVPNGPSEPLGDYAAGVPRRASADSQSVPDAHNNIELQGVRSELSDASRYFNTHASDVGANQRYKSPSGSREAKLKAPSKALILGVIIGVLVCACAYVTYLAVRWSDFGEATHQANQELGLTIAQTTEELESARASLEATRSQLTTAQQRISELANEKAEASDDREQQRIRAEDTFAVATESLGISADLAQCLTLQNKANSYLTEISNAQSVVASQALKPVDERDTEAITTASQTISAQRDSLMNMQDSMISTCQDAIDRHNNLIDDLQE